MPGMSGISPLLGNLGGLAAHDGGVDLGEEVGHDRFAFFVDHKIIDGAVAARNIAVDADSESQDDFPWHAEIVIWTVDLPSRGNEQDRHARRGGRPSNNALRTMGRPRGIMRSFSLNP